jgi:hypothetical protein
VGGRRSARWDLQVLYSLGCLVSQGFIPPCLLAGPKGASLCQAVGEESEEVAVEVSKRPANRAYAGAVHSPALHGGLPFPQAALFCWLLQGY